MVFKIFYLITVRIMFSDLSWDHLVKGIVLVRDFPTSNMAFSVDTMFRPLDNCIVIVFLV